MNHLIKAYIELLSIADYIATDDQLLFINAKLIQLKTLEERYMFLYYYLYCDNYSQEYN